MDYYEFLKQMLYNQEENFQDSQQNNTKPRLKLIKKVHWLIGSYDNNYAPIGGKLMERESMLDVSTSLRCCHWIRSFKEQDLYTQQEKFIDWVIQRGYYDVDFDGVYYMIRWSK